MNFAQGTISRRKIVPIRNDSAPTIFGYLVLMRLALFLTSKPHPSRAIPAAPAKHVPTYIITFSNLPPPTSKPVRSCSQDASTLVELALLLGAFHATSCEEIVADRIFPAPRVSMRYPEMDVERVGSFSVRGNAYQTITVSWE